MTNKPIHRNDGYSKKELIKILAEIDADKNQAERLNTHRKTNYSHSNREHGETR